MNDSRTEPGNIGVLVVHGIGEQEANDTIGKLLTGLQHVEHALEVEEAVAGKTVIIGGQDVRFYEAYWADLLKGEKIIGSFQMNELQSLSWFPWLNFRRGNYQPGDYSLLKRVWWIVLLPLANFLIYLGYNGLSFLAQMGNSLKGQRDDGDLGTSSSIPAVLRKVVRRSNKYTIVDEKLDEFVGDVFNYVNSAGDAFYREKEEPLIPDEIRKVYPEIVQRFYTQLLKAHTDGCTSIQVVAHSLGTVVTYHALAGLGFDAETREDADAIRAARSKVTNLYTIGCPLEKIRFFWPRLISTRSPFGEMQVKWENFVSWFDPVAGVLRRFKEWGDVENHHLLGGGFIRAHVVYERSPVFLGALTKGLCGREMTVQRTLTKRLKDFIALVGETLFTPAIIALVLAVGLLVFGLTVSVLPFVFSLPFRPFVNQEVLGLIQDVASLAIAVILVIAVVFGSSVRASRVHRRYWASAPH